MKRFATLTLFALSLMLFSCIDTDQNNSTPEIIDTKNKIEVIDFHTTRRCKTCNAIEANTIYTLETFFADEMKNGTITFQSINIDEEENYSIAEKFQASGTSLFLNVIIDGKEKQVNLTSAAFKKGRDRDAFSSDLRKFINKHLKEI